MFKLYISKYSNNLGAYDFTNNQLNNYSLTKELFPIIINDILNFSSLVNTDTLKMSTTTLIISDNQVKEHISISKNYTTKQILISINGISQNLDLYKYISKKYRINFTLDLWKQRVIDLAVNKFPDFVNLNLYINNINNIIGGDKNANKNPEEDKIELEDLIKQTSIGLDSDSISRISKLREVRLKMNEIQILIDSYLNEKKIREDLTNKIKEVENSKDQAANMIDSAKILIESRKTLMTELSRFGNIGVDTNIQRKVDMYKSSKRNKLYSLLYNIRSSTNAIHRLSQEDVTVFVGSPIIVMLFIEVLITITLYVLSSEIRVLLSGFLSFITLLILLGFTNLSKLMVPLTKRSIVPPPKTTFQDLLGRDNDHSTEKLVVSLAWYNALKNELTSVELMIKQRLNNKSYEQVFNEVQLMTDTLAKYKSQLEDLNSKILSSEEYYKKRREVDILKIEKENLEYSTKIDPQLESRIDELSLKLSSIEKNEEKVENVNISINLPLIILNLNSAVDSIKFEIDKLRKVNQIILFELT